MFGQAMKVTNKETSMSSVTLISKKTLIKEIEDDSTSLREMPLRNPNNPSTHISSLDDTEQKFDADKDAENAIEVNREKPATDDNHHGVAAKKRKVPFADETAAKEAVKPWNLRNKKRKPMKLGESDEENSDEVKGLMKANFSLCLSKKEIKEDLLRLQKKGDSKEPSSKPKQRPPNVQKAIDRLLPGFEITKIIDGAIRRECQRRQADRKKKFYPRSKKS